MSTEFKLPDLGEGIEAGEVVSVLVSEGDEVEANQNVLELETDKAIVELPCPHAGRVVKIHVSAGQRIPVGQTILTLEPSAGTESAAASAAAPKAAEEPVETSAEAPAEKDSAATAREAPEPVESPARATEPAATRPAERAPVAAEPAAASTDERPAPAGPATRRLARELGVDLHRVAPTGPHGRITIDDVQQFVRRLASGSAATAATGGPIVAPALPDFAQWGPVEEQPLKGIRKVTAEAMSVAWSTVPHVTQFDESDITELEAARRRWSEASKRAGASEAKITVTVLALKAAAIALGEFPQFNASIDVAGQRIIYKRHYHIGVAVDTEHGLMVPVLRDVDQKSIEELAVELEDLAARAKARKIDLDELRGGTFTITNLGGIGGTGFTPIVNWPEVAILGIARSKEEVVLRDGQPTSRLKMPLCLSYDHRLIDGADGARFTRRVASLLEDPFRLLVHA